MGVKVCVVDGCWEGTTGTRCVVHEREYQRARNARRGKARTRHAAYRGLSLEGRECACCGTGGDLTRHHVIPLSWQQTPMPALPEWCCGFTIVALCRRCNSSVGDRLMVTRECPMHGGNAWGAR